MNNDVYLRKITSDDWRAFRAIRLAGLKSDPQAFGGSFEEETARKEPEWRKRLEARDRFFFGAEKEGKFLAIAGAKKLDDEVWMVVGVHTLPPERGKGLAQALIREVVAFARESGAATMRLAVNVDQKDAVRVYEKAGFRVIKTLKDQMMGDGKPHDEYVMEKKLADSKEVCINVPMRLIGIDYGEKRVGVALSDDKGMMAFPKAVLPNDKFLMTELRDLIKGHDVETAVIGESKDYNMKDNRIMPKVRAFAAELERETGIVTVYEPEVLSSHQAAHFQGKTAMIDASAASIILQSYIDRSKNK